MTEIVVPRQIQEAVKRRGSTLGFVLTRAECEWIGNRYEFIAERINPKDKVLDIGCGLGIGLKKLGLAETVVAIDISPERTSEASLRNKGFPNIHVSQMDATELNFPDNFFDKLSRWRL